ncbi:MAG: hypothetical protein Kow00122_04900 [Thermoleophilia bacterium]
MLARAGRLFDLVLDIMAWGAGICVAFVLIVVSLGAVTRYAFHYPITWTTELTEYALLYLTFLLGPWVLLNDKHVKVDILTNLLSARHPRAHAAVLLAGDVIGIAVFSLITYYGIIVTADFFSRHVSSTTILSVPKGPLLMVIPLSAACLVIQFARRAAATTRALRGDRPVTAPPGDRSLADLTDGEP